MATRRTARRRSWGTLRTMRNGRIQASYIYDGDGRRYYAIHTYDSKMDAEGWLANERKLIELGEWSPPEARAKLQALTGVTLREYAEQWMEHRDLRPKTRSLYTRLLNTRILPGLGDEILRAVTPAKVRAWWVGFRLRRHRGLHWRNDAAETGPRRRAPDLQRNPLRHSPLRCLDKLVFRWGV